FYNIYKNNLLLKTIQDNLNICEYLDECIIYGDAYSYFVETVYNAGSTYSVTNASLPHNQYLLNNEIGSGGGKIANIFAGLSLRENTLAAPYVFSISVLSNDNYSFFEKNLTVYNQINISSSPSCSAFPADMKLVFKIPVTNQQLVFRKNLNPGYTINNRNNLLIAKWDEKRDWIKLSAISRLEKKSDNFSFLLLETSVNSLGTFGIVYNADDDYCKQVQVKNRMFAPFAGFPGLAAASITFPNPKKESVQIVIYNISGSRILQKKFDFGLMAYSWDGKIANDEIAAPGLYIVNIIIDGKEKEAYKTYIYLMK
ncbi:MAG TPA: hypothetical protein DC049_10115, partial [Spirochaetia bacterium]|nr:hypothetical protein [Spirochaetia bacterium]